MAGKLRVIEASGSHYDIGRQIGRQTKEQTRALAGALRRTSADDPIARARYADYMRHVEQFPLIIDEIRGMADGAGLPFDVIARIQVVELNRSLPKADGCTTLVVKDARRLIVGHNEDGGRADDVFLLKAAYPSGLRLLAICYIGSLAGHAPFVNSHGLACTCNALSARDFRVGEPKRVFCRRIVDAAGIDEAVELLAGSVRAEGENFVLAQGDRAVGVEVSATDMRVQEITGSYYHCNNYLHADMLQYEGEGASSNTFARSAEARRVCGALRTVPEVHASLSSHANHPDCFCRHNGGKTLACSYFDCTQKRILLGYGPPCQAEMEEFTVDWAW